MAPSLSEYTAINEIPNVINVDFMLPNGLYSTLACSKDMSLFEVKSKLWDEINDKYSNFFHFKTPNDYVFASITHEAQNIEFYDYALKLGDLKLLHWFFKLNEIEGNLEEKQLSANLSRIVGFDVDEFKLVKDTEILNYRLELYKIIQERLNEENLEINTNQLNLALFKSIYAPNLEVDSSEFQTNSNKNNKTSIKRDYSKKIELHVYDTTSETNEPNEQAQLFVLNVSLDATPLDIISEFFRLKYSIRADDVKNIKLLKCQKTFLLSVCGCDEVMFGNEFKIGQYKYIKKCISNNNFPCFHIVKYKNLINQLPKDNKQLTFYIENTIEEQRQQIDYHLKRSAEPDKIVELSWECNEKFEIYLDYLGLLPTLEDCDRVFLKIALFHGQEPITEVFESDKKDWDTTNRDLHYYLFLNQTISFDMSIKNLHRCCKLCITLNYVTKKKRELCMVGSLCINLFDYRGVLIDGKKDLYMWPNSSKEPFESIFCSDFSGSNSNKNFGRLKCEFLTSNKKRRIRYPNNIEIKGFIDRCSVNSQDDCFDIFYTLDNDVYLLECIIGKDPLAELTEQDKDILWRRRQDLINYPSSLPKLLQSVQWHKQSNVIEIYNLLNRWPLLKPVIALELLNGFYADIEVRKFAIKCLDRVAKNEEIELYLLQLVQALKNESYLNNELSKFLLRRALKCQRFGFDLFWNLKSEMKNPRYKYLFGILIEAYSRGAGASLSILFKQNEVVEKLSALAQMVKSDPDNLTLIRGTFLQDTLRLPAVNQMLSNFVNPLNRSDFIGKIDADKCRILSSAKRPIFLHWTNTRDYSSFYEKTYQLIFKHGDDLRQDMLTLQVLNLMNIIWKNEGLDLKMLIYNCYSMGFKVGFIEVIKDSDTIFKIQTDAGARGRYQIDTAQLYKWLCANNLNKLDQAIDNFTKSCAGFCVATFILGIGDRHPDNIMINKEGKLFHIDFGHFLGHFKKKLGFKRERVPFVLTEDFTRVIARGASNPIDTVEFKNFRTLCEEAYMIIRKYSNLIINLFTLMLPSGMPELQSTEDISYLRKKLAIEDCDEDALEFFRSQFAESHTYSFTTKFDWVFHALNKNNR